MSTSSVSARAAESADLDTDVAIVGGGPGGLTTAAAILSAFGQRVRVKVRPRNRSAVASNRVPLQTSDLATTHAQHSQAVKQSSVRTERYPVTLQVYESMKEYTLQGSAVGLGPNAQHALEAVNPDLLARYIAFGDSRSIIHQRIAAV